MSSNPVLRAICGAAALMAVCFCKSIHVGLRGADVVLASHSLSHLSAGLASLRACSALCSYCATGVTRTDVCTGQESWDDKCHQLTEKVAAIVQQNQSDVDELTQVCGPLWAWSCRYVACPCVPLHTAPRPCSGTLCGHLPSGARIFSMSLATAVSVPCPS